MKSCRFCTVVHPIRSDPIRLRRWPSQPVTAAGAPRTFTGRIKRNLDESACKFSVTLHTHRSPTSSHELQQQRKQGLSAKKEEVSAAHEDFKDFASLQFMWLVCHHYCCFISNARINVRVSSTCRKTKLSRAENRSQHPKASRHRRQECNVRCVRQFAPHPLPSGELGVRTERGASVLDHKNNIL